MNMFHTPHVPRRKGGEMFEYALIFFLLLIAVLAIVGSIGGKFIAKQNVARSATPTTAQVERP